MVYVPADAFYEWQAETRLKQLWRLSLAGGEPLAIAGLWHGWRDDADQPAERFLLLTTDASATVAPCHDRMPVPLGPEAWPMWLAQDSAAEGLQPLLRPWSGAMDAWPLTAALNRAGFEEPAARVAPPPSRTELFRFTPL